MKKIQFIIATIVLGFLFSCTNENEDVNVDGIEAPTNISALMTIKQDNSGKVTFLPRGEGITQYEIFYGDGTTQPGIVNPGGTIDHNYPEGVYQVKVVGISLNGKRTEAVQELTVSFLAPTDLNATIASVSGNNLAITVQATANLETYFQVYFGDVPNEVPTNFNEGETITHVYPSVGTYTVTVVALSGGAATTQVTQTVTISDPLLLPIDFESSTLNYSFVNFGGANSTVVTNPDVSALNTSSKVGKLTKGNGSEIWAGSFIELSSPIDFSVLQKIKMKVWSPQSGIVVKMKLENSANSSINVEVDATNTVAKEEVAGGVNVSGAPPNRGSDLPPTANVTVSPTL